MKTINDLPVNIQMISCPLDELAESCKIITKETFKLFNLKEKQELSIILLSHQRQNNVRQPRNIRKKKIFKDEN
jgi:hypothetical protein